MRKGMDFVLWRKLRVNNRTGALVEDNSYWARPLWGRKELARRRAASKRAKLARRKNR